MECQAVRTSWPTLALKNGWTLKSSTLWSGMQRVVNTKCPGLEPEVVGIDEILAIDRSPQPLPVKSVSIRYRYRIGDLKKREGEGAYRRLARQIVEQYAQGKLEASNYVFPESAFQIIRSKMNRK